MIKEAMQCKLKVKSEKLKVKNQYFVLKLNRRNLAPTFNF